jgi:uncharacterized Ntn-hydrolase superfamily protein
MSSTRALPALLLSLAAVTGPRLLAAPPGPSTFSIAASDPATGEVGVAVASRFFAVGTVVPWARAGVGAVATQASANTSFGPSGLELMARGLSAEEALKVLLRGDEGRDRRQVGLVTASGDSATYSGPGCNSWAGGRRGPNYAVQGNILTGEAVVAAMEKSFLASAAKPLAERLLAALAAGDAAGGDSRGRQSAALLVCRAKGGYNGFTDRAVDVRVDDHADPFRELTRLVGMGVVNDLWNQGWTAFTEKRFADALKAQEQATTRAEGQPAMLPEVVYDLAVIRLAAGNRAGAVEAARRALKLNPKLAAQAKSDPDLEAIRTELP